MTGNNNGIKYEIDFLTTEETGQEVKKLLEELGGVITDEKASAKIQLSYLIKKQKYAFLNSLAFTINPNNNLKGVIDNLKLQSNTLRFMIKRFQRKNDKKLKLPLRTRVVRKTLKIRKPALLKKKVEILTNEDLEKKIQEIDLGSTIV